MYWIHFTLDITAAVVVFTTVCMLINADRIIRRKEKMIERLNDKVMAYRVAVAELNATTRQEKDDDHVL